MPVSPKGFCDALIGQGVDFFTGVPDSLLKDVLLCIEESVPEAHHIIAANEGNAVAIAAGYHLATGKIPLVYMQNSGLGNALNPLLSLCDPQVYSIPMILLVGWRGEPGVPDAVQHGKDGRIQLDLLDAVELPYLVVSHEETDMDGKIRQALEIASREERPFVILVKKGAFEKFDGKPVTRDGELMLREEALEVILDHLDKDAAVISTTGKTSREVFEVRTRRGQPHSGDFLTVGSMGHCSSIALGVAVARPERKVICIDGDGALLMHLGSLATIGKVSPKNFSHILINNGVHESVGGQSTAIDSLSLSDLVTSSGYESFTSVEARNELAAILDGFLGQGGLKFLEVKVRPGSRENLGRPTVSPTENKKAFQQFLKAG